ncbi:metallophosphoesterase [Candidatus Chrysopegis kryptomonas]|uniref:Predicted phosphohydrolase, MPP superfamily n=1 Tax=Candidatus Chryseopegocella kryptomonas TaxID=1633643 RepID=A0A0P1MVQ0_9BACT|nr:metallophosphoesterase [Candidatus Chrysopegis kryptomonas]CUS99694.1 Predicted phosphohydrolase, MPP superfamily [Candidatus Chrysopegis kryptomonas]
MTLLLLGLLILIYSYLTLKISTAVKQTINPNQSILKFFTIFIPLYLVSYPLVGLIGFFLGLQSLISSFRFGNKIFDVLFTYPFWFGLVFAVQTFFPLLAIDIVKIISSLIATSNLQAKINSILPRLTLLIALTSAIYSGIKIYIDTNAIKQKTIDFEIENLHPSLNNFKIVHISDIQADARTKREKIQKYIDIVNSTNPDIVIFTGDMVTYGTEHIPIAVEMLSKIKSKSGFYACIGDHDYWAGIENIKSEMQKYGLKLYSNENLRLKINNANLTLTFITNIYSERPNFETLNSLLSENNADLKILITHQPSENLVELAHENGYKIFLAGHTHGGQVTFSIFGFKIVPSRVETKYVSGDYRFNSMLINVNNGLGFTLAPIRLNAPAEVTIIKLRSKVK